MKVSILYSSRTGNTKKLALGIADELKDFETSVMDLETVNSLPEADAYLVGYWVDRATINEHAKQWIDQITAKPVGLFGTLGAYAYSEHGSTSMQNANGLLNKDCTLIGSFLCQGSVDPKLLEKFKNLPQGDVHALTPEKEMRHKVASQHPNELDAKYAAQLFRERLLLL